MAYIAFMALFWHWKISSGRHFQNGRHNTAQIQHCPISTTFQMWVDYDVPNLFLTLKNFLAVAILDFDQTWHILSPYKYVEPYWFSKSYVKGLDHRVILPLFFVIIHVCRLLALTCWVVGFLHCTFTSARPKLPVWQDLDYLK
jgi:hypothetical protein